MSVRILEIKKESCPASRFIGKKYIDFPNWGEWWENGWFEALEQLPWLPINDSGYIGAVHIVSGKPEYWIGMFFPAETAVPNGFDCIEVGPTDYAVCYLYAKDMDPELHSMDTHNACLDALKAVGFQRKEDDWCFERYNCPRFTTPDALGNIILDYAISVKGE